MDREAFVAALRPVLRALARGSPSGRGRRRPFASVAQLHETMCGVVRAASPDEQLALIRAHPDLVGRLRARASSRANRPASRPPPGSTRFRPTRSRRSSGTTPPTASDSDSRSSSAPARIGRTRSSPRFPQRLANSREQEIATALGEIDKIARLRHERRDLGGLTPMAVVPAHNSYGKSAVRLTKVVRNGSRPRAVRDRRRHPARRRLRGRVSRRRQPQRRRDRHDQEHRVRARQGAAFKSVEEFAIILAEHFVDDVPAGRRRRPSS